jgi:hypothetical protein
MWLMTHSTLLIFFVQPSHKLIDRHQTQEVVPERSNIFRLQHTYWVRPKKVNPVLVQRMLVGPSPNNTNA